MSNNKPTYTISGSQAAAVKYTMNDVANAIKNVAANIISPMSSSGYIYAPYVPLQTTNVFADITTKSILNVLLNSNSTMEKNYNITLAQKYQFLSNHIKVLENSSEPKIYEFKIGDMFFISNIIEIKNEFHAYPVSENYNTDYLIETVTLNVDENEFVFKNKEFIHMLDNQILVKI